MNPTSHTDAVRHYLDHLKRALRVLPSEDRAAILAEIESHIADRISGGGSVDDALASLGDPAELAQAYLEQYKLEDALSRASNVSLMAAIFERATRNVLALATGLGALMLYLFAVSFAAVAVLKPVLPQSVGFWWGKSDYALGILDKAPTDTPELLGYGIIPISVVACVLCYLAGTALMRFGGRLLLRKSAIPQKT
jgi:uncharacterized membrane protein